MNNLKKKNKAAETKKSSNIRLLSVSFLIGLANVVPGVSGGTIAFIFSLYEQIIDTLHFFLKLPLSIAQRKKVDVVEFKNKLIFSSILGVGLLLGILFAAQIVEKAFLFYPQETWALFFGFILSSLFFLLKKIKITHFGNLFLFLFPIAILFLLAVAKPLQENSSLVFVFLCGMIGISSMILPGLSGSFMLIVLGNYQLILRSVNEGNKLILFTFLGGGFFSFVCIAPVLKFILNKYYEKTFSFICGLVAGSLFLLWPWKVENYLKDSVGEFLLKDGNKVVESYSFHFPEYHFKNLIIFSIIMIGFFVYYLMNRFSEKSN